MNRVFFGDCRDAMRTLIADDVRVQMCVTSPPYYKQRDYGHKGQIGQEDTLENYIDAICECTDLVFQILNDDGCFWLNLGDGYLPGGQLSAAAWRIAIEMQSRGWILRQDIIWHKPAPMPEPVKNRCTRAHEYLFMFSKKPTYYYDADAVREPSVMKPQRRLTSRSDHPKGDEGRPAHRRPEGGAKYETRNRRSVWTIPTTPFKGAHFAIFPPALVEVCIKASSRQGDTVLDPFFGSGTTGEVAEKLGRTWIGCELNQDYEPLQRERTAKNTKSGQLRLPD